MFLSIQALSSLLEMIALWLTLMPFVRLPIDRQQIINSGLKGLSADSNVSYATQKMIKSSQNKRTVMVPDAGQQNMNRI